ncbi:GDP-L-fucose synthase [Methanobrevibacter sp.]|uniref:GDP-L-fucose synthase family protein n=1 Tax=Methanobrevibacter sp. TaxID=66852 RepID=UPI0025D5B27C|nr:GDP-L-fucose synthase [Methanobrevibacter sp.]MBQ2831604.1 GDP-L-fucose synthase [Methanobrevibacter sp.]
MDFSDRIYVAGHNGMVGSAIVRALKKRGYNNLILKSHSELDLTRQADVENFFKQEKPDSLFLAAAKVGGINANMNNPVDFLMENIIIQYNIIKSAFENDVEKLVFLGSSCIYPTKAKQPLKEEYLMSGPLEPTNEGYALAKIVGLKACEFYNKQYGTNYISVMPPNIYGINDNFDLENAHVVASLIRKMHEAKIFNKPQVDIWGTGNQYRELMFVDDMADATLFAFENYDGDSFINIGVGKDYTIRELAETIKHVVNYEGELYFDTSKPDGMFRKVLDVNQFEKLGWKAKYSLEEGIKLTYNWFLKNYGADYDD